MTRHGEGGAQSAAPMPREAEGLVFDPEVKAAKIADLQRIRAKADRSAEVTRAARMIVLSAVLALESAAESKLAEIMWEAPLWAQLVVLAFALLALVFSGMSVWRWFGLYLRGVEIDRVRKTAEVLDDERSVLPKSLLDGFYISDQVTDEALWAATVKMHHLNIAWADVVGLRARRNLTLEQELELLRAENTARAVVEEVGELLNPGSARGPA